MDETTTREEKKEQRKLTASLVFIVIGLLALLITVYFHDYYEPPQKDFNIPEVDVNVVELDKVKTPNGIDKDATGGYASVTYSKDVLVDLSDKTATFMFQNPSNSGALMKIELVADDTLSMATSGIIEPGFGIDSSIEVNTEGLEVGNYQGYIQVNHYNPDTGEKAILSLKVPVTIVVTM